MNGKNTVFYQCPICGNTIGLINGNIQNMTCCGRQMVLLEANSVDASHEKHVPVCTVENNEVSVSVGETIHPMEENHYIMWVALMNEHQTTRIRLHPGETPVVKFPYIPGSTIYAYCNQHGLWKAEIK